MSPASYDPPKFEQEGTASAESPGANTEADLAWSRAKKQRPWQATTLRLLAWQRRRTNRGGRKPRLSDLQLSVPALNLSELTGRDGVRLYIFVV